MTMMQRGREDALSPVGSSSWSSRVRRVIGLMAVAMLAVLVGPAPSAWAHGEDSQQAFERTATVAFYDIKFSSEKMNIGDDVVITGKVRVMAAWPDHTIGPPELGYLNLLAPGPVFYIQERWMSGEFTPQSVRVSKGSTYPFKIVAKARIPGRWHIHPSMAMEGSGTLVGEGRWLTINDQGTFTQPVQLTTGETIDIGNNYGLGRVWFWTLLGVVVAAGYLLYWLWNPLLQRAVDLREGRSIVTGRDRKVSILFAIIAFVVTIAGGVYAHMATPSMVPIQVARVTPTPETPSKLQTAIGVDVTEAKFEEGSGTLTLQVTIKNTSPNPVQFNKLQFSEYEVVNPVVNPGALRENQTAGTFTPSNPIAPGQTQKITVKMDGAALAAKNLIPVDEAQSTLTGLIFIRDNTGQDAVAEVNEVTSGVIPLP